jgi:hypothetical protein
MSRGYGSYRCASSSAASRFESPVQGEVKGSKDSVTDHNKISCSVHKRCEVS